MQVALRDMGCALAEAEVLDDATLGISSTDARFEPRLERTQGSFAMGHKSGRRPLRVRANDKVGQKW